MIAALIAFSGLAQADLSQGTPFFTWTAPTQFTDGSPLVPATDLSGYPIRCSGNPVPVHTAPSTAINWQSIAGDFTPGTYDCNITAQTVGGVESILAPFPRFTVTPAVVQSNPPTGTDVQ